MDCVSVHIEGGKKSTSIFKPSIFYPSNIDASISPGKSIQQVLKHSK